MFEPGAQPLALFGRHVFPVLAPHMPAPAAATVAVPAAAAEAAEEDATENQQARCLPEIQCRNSEQMRNDRIPQAHDHEAQHSDQGEPEHYKCRPFCNPTTSKPHDVLLMANRGA